MAKKILETGSEILTIAEAQLEIEMAYEAKIVKARKIKEQIPRNPAVPFGIQKGKRKYG